MNRDELLRALAEARTARTARARLLLQRLWSSRGEPWIDAGMRAELEDLARRCGRRLEAARAPTSGVGETWLPLVAAGGRGDVVRLCARADGADAGIRFDAEVERALRGLRAAASRARAYLPAEVFHRRFTILGGEAGLHIDGTSLGLAACMAALSTAAQAAPRENVVGSAAVDAEGRLLPVAGIEAKMRALVTQWPQLDTFVVGIDQQGVPEDSRLRVERAATVVEAAAIFGLYLPTAGRPSKQELHRRLLDLEHAEERPHAVGAWERLSLDAEALADDLRDVDAEQSHRALLLAGTLASHAGDPRRARSVLARFAPGTAPPALVARERVITASASIDTHPEGALAAAIQAVALCDALPGREWLGRALGTHGRVLLHTGRAAEAEPLLRRALDHHEHDDDEGPRSALYLAQCLRHQGRADEALVLADGALARAEANRQSEPSHASRLHAQLERGRALLDLGRAAEAISALEDVVGGQPVIAAYPSLGARRTLVRAHRAIGDLVSARRHLALCVEVAITPSVHETLRKVGAVAAGEELIGGHGGELATVSRLELAWFSSFADAPTTSGVSGWVY